MATINKLSSLLLFLGRKTSDEEMRKKFNEYNLEINHPVGSHYWTDDDNDDPAVRFGGGTWELTKGRFLVGSGNNGKADDQALNLETGAEGGESKHRLTSSESGIPTHSHALNTNGYWALGAPDGTSLTNDGGSDISGSGYHHPRIPSSKDWGRLFSTANKDGTSASASHNNLPPYHATNWWTRIA